MIEPHYPKAGRRGRQPYPLATMLRLYFLQQGYALSDPGLEDALYEIESMRRFVGLESADDALPDETTLLNFRRLVAGRPSAYECPATTANPSWSKTKAITCGGNQPMTPRRVLNKAESAACLGLSTEAFDKKRQRQTAPFKNIRAILYDMRDLDDWPDRLKCRERQES